MKRQIRESAPAAQTALPSAETKNYAVIIPALNPIPGMVDLVRQLLQQGVAQVIVVNDGSDESYDPIFDAVEKMDNCAVLRHPINRGKGRALKTAFAHVLKHHQQLDGVVTADADGQHTIDDICKIGERLAAEQESLILGVRNFQEENVPLRSYIGNTLTSRVFHWWYGVELHDTQTGLRGIPLQAISWMVDLEGERYDLEINMLIHAKRHNLKLLTIPIATVYYDNNANSHYSTIGDSLFILWRLILGLIK
ncbi:MAG: glycosyltransferase family 2 protein [Bacillota bacterium]